MISGKLFPTSREKSVGQSKRSFFISVKPTIERNLYMDKRFKQRLFLVPRQTRFCMLIPLNLRKSTYKNKTVGVRAWEVYFAFAIFLAGGRAYRFSTPE